MGLRVRPQPRLAADPLGQAFEIALERVEVNHQGWSVDLVERHADLGGRTGGHRQASELVCAEACAPEKEMQHDEAARSASSRRF
jgi:hypothetical protein